MTRLEAIQDAYLLATAKTTLPLPGSSKRMRLEQLAIKYNRDWQTEPDTEWESLYADVGAGTITANQDTYELDTEINFISKIEGNYVRVEVTPGNFREFKPVAPQKLHQYRLSDYVAKVADNSIKFSRTYTAADELIGASILVPAIIKLDDLTSDSSEVLIDNPNWLPARMAAQYVLNDRQLNYLYPDLLDQANELMLSMKINNTPVSASYNTGLNYFPNMDTIGHSSGNVL